MAIPGLKPKLEMRAKVRVGDKVDGRARSLDYFVCPDEEFSALVGDKATAFEIVFPFASPDQVWSSGLELWKQGRQKNHLACYTKGDGVAHRIGYGGDGEPFDVDLSILGDRQARDKRFDMPCDGFECPLYGKTGCRPVARLEFQLPGGRRDSVLRWETKSLNAIEQIEGVLGQHRDLRGVVFELYVERVKQGAKEFPVVGLRELDGGAEHEASAGTSEPQTGGVSVDLRAEVIDLLRQLDQDPRDPAVAKWVKEHGLASARDALRRRLDG